MKLGLSGGGAGLGGGVVAGWHGRLGRLGLGDLAWETWLGRFGLGDLAWETKTTGTTETTGTQPLEICTSVN